MKLRNKQAEVLARVGAVRAGYQQLSVGFGSGIRMATARALEQAGLVQLVIEQQRDNRPHAWARGRPLTIHILAITDAGRAALRATG